MADHAFVLVEYGDNAADRRPVADLGVLYMPATEAAEMNRQLVHTPCRVLPASWFPDVDGSRG